MAGPYIPRSMTAAGPGHKTASPSPLRQSTVANSKSAAVSAGAGLSLSPSKAAAQPRYGTAVGSSVSAYMSNSNAYPPALYGHAAANTAAAPSPAPSSTQPASSTGTPKTLVSGSTSRAASHRRGISDSPSTVRGIENIPNTSFSHLQHHFDYGAGQSAHSRTNPPSPEKPRLGRDLGHIRAQSHSDLPRLRPGPDTATDGGPGKVNQALSMATLHRADSVRTRGDGGAASAGFPSQVGVESLKRSSTRHLRTLSKFVTADKPDLGFGMTARADDVTGLHGRRRLRRGSSEVEPRNRNWGSTAWMDAQRQFLQAYEYLCHIGEAKEWIEGVLDKPIAEIVELEEALRDGVTLAEVVQALRPERQVKIFRSDKLQYRHSDNIAIFFNFLADVDLADLFRFELVDLYEKKNIPKVIYCIHALSWLLFRKGIVQFRIGNLVGHLTFEDHELEATQKGLDRAGVSMPNFSTVQANFIEETEDERIEREMGAHENVLVDLQSQMRGYAIRLKLGDVVQQLWEMEDWVLDLQCRVRGGVSRQLFRYRADRNRFVCQLQAATRGFLVRARDRTRRTDIAGCSGTVSRFQAAIRGRTVRAELATVVSAANAHGRAITTFQAAVRGAMARHVVAGIYEDAHDETAQPAITALQAAVRGKLVRTRHQARTEAVKSIASTSSVSLVQAAIRGKAVRDRVEAVLYEIEGPDVQQTISRFQSVVRGFVSRTSKTRTQKQLQTAAVVQSLTQLQAAVRGVMARAVQLELQEALEEDATVWTNLQAQIHGMRQRKKMASLLSELASHQDGVSRLQAASKGAAQRRQIGATKAALQAEEHSITTLATFIRGHLARQRFSTMKQQLDEATSSVLAVQSAIRGSAERQRTYDFLCRLNDQEETVVELQSLIRAMNSRVPLGEQLIRLDAEAGVVEQMQSAIRGLVVRRRFEDKKRHYEENMKKVIAVQSFVRGKQQGQAYQTLIHGKNPPVGTVKNFVHLLNDSDLDFDEEVEFENTRKMVVQRVRQNEMAEQYINQLDIKIALLVKNKITLDEVIKHQKHFGGHVANLLANRDPITSRDPFDLRALNKNSRRKLEHYQELFFTLQTQPHYLARLARRVTEHGMADKDSKRLEQLVMGIFGFAQKRREEYYLLKLVGRAVEEEAELSDSVHQFGRMSFFWARIVANYVRTPRDRKFLRDFLSPIIREDIMNVADLDLESDPLQIYRSIINNEELRTGRRSGRPPDIPREDAIRDPDTRETFIRHLQDLRDITDHFFVLFDEMVGQMPYGVRFVGQHVYETLLARFPDEDETTVLFAAGNWLWRSYLQPALVQPEQWSVIDRGLSPLQRRNLTEVGKVISQIAAGKLFGGDNIYLQPMNPYVTDSLDRMADLWRAVLSVPDAETQFEIDEFNDLYARTKPTVYIKLADIFAVHQYVMNDLAVLAPANDDVLRDIVRELGSVKANESELVAVSSTEVSLTLTGRFHNLDDPDAGTKGMWMETKRCILYIIRIQSGANLLEIMVRQVTRDDEAKWRELVTDEIAQRARDRARQRRITYSTLSDGASVAGSIAPSALDILALAYSDVKRIALENIVSLERAGLISRQNGYQDILNSIAHDMRTKHRRRIQRARELEGAQATLAALDEKAEWLDGQLKSYNDYVEQAMVTLQTKTGSRRKRFLLPFTRQYNHVRELQRTGRVPRFGSYKYSVRNLAEKGVVVGWRGYLDRQWDRISITISSDEVGVFHIEGSSGSLMIPGASAVVPLDDLLQAQFNNCQFMNIFSPESAGDSVAAGAIPVNGSGSGISGPTASQTNLGSTSSGESGPLRLNVNLLVHLLMRKFYREE